MRKRLGALDTALRVAPAQTRSCQRAGEAPNRFEAVRAATAELLSSQYYIAAKAKLLRRFLGVGGA